MKNKKGFTLIEMLLTGALVVVIAIIVVPNIVSTYKKAKENEYQRFLNDLFLSTEAYVQKYTDYYEDLKNIDGKAYIYVDELLESRYLKSTLYDAKNKKHIKDESDFTIEVTKKEDGSYTYKLYEGHYPSDISDVTQSLLDKNTEYGNYTYMGGTYLKGVQNNNYVWYNGFMWRIMGKNSDGTIKLITEDNITAIPWGASDTENWNVTGYIKDWLNSESEGAYSFFSHLNDTKSIIEDSTWCINSTTTTGSARTDCTGGNTFNAKVGLISIDEYNLSGASETNNNYLVNGQFYWTLTSHSISKTWYVSNIGFANSRDVTSCYGTRPVINVKADAIITVGDGTNETPYMLEQANTNVTNKTLNEKVTSGEYVKISNKMYRVVSKEEQGIKLILDGYYEETAGTVTKTVYGANNTFTGSAIDTLLNGDVLAWLNSNKIINANWNQGGLLASGYSYIISLTNSGNNITRKVGLIRIGEMLASQSSTILTKNYTVSSISSNAENYRTLTPYSTSYAWSVNNNGYANANDVTVTNAVRPVIYVSGANMINGGTGVWNNPYIID